MDEFRGEKCKGFFYCSRRYLGAVQEVTLSERQILLPYCFSKKDDELGTQSF